MEQITLVGVPKRAARKVHSLSKIAVPIIEADRLIDHSLASQPYFSEFDRVTLLEKLRPTAMLVDEVDPYGWLREIPELAAKHRRLIDYLKGGRGEIQLRNAEFVDSNIRSLLDWFEKEEKTKLSDEQAAAVLVMESSHLLVASAGSGKTSTILAKAKYAISTGYCSPNEVLILSFNRKVRDEISLRMGELATSFESAAAVAIETFHSFGNKQVKRLDKHVRTAPWAANTQAEMEHFGNLIQSLIENDSQFALDLAHFCALWSHSDEVEESEIRTATGCSTIEAAMRALDEGKASPVAVPTYFTLNGETVRSLQELRICNWLALMGVQYSYEKPFETYELPPEWSSGYRPDFYYPEIDCWHEHFGVNKHGQAPQWRAGGKGSGQSSYEQQMQIKRAFLSNCGVDWFETTSGDFQSGTWENKLCLELESRGLTPAFVGSEVFSTSWWEVS